MTHLFNTIIKDFNVERTQRGYQLPIETMNINNDLPNDLVDMLYDVTTQSNHLVQRYYKIKKDLLGLDSMTLADIYAPMDDNLPLIDWDLLRIWYWIVFRRLIQNFMNLHWICLIVIVFMCFRQK